MDRWPIIAKVSIRVNHHVRERKKRIANAELNLKRYSEVKSIYDMKNVNLLDDVIMITIGNLDQQIYYGYKSFY